MVISLWCAVCGRMSNLISVSLWHWLHRVMPRHPLFWPGGPPRHLKQRTEVAYTAASTLIAGAFFFSSLTLVDSLFLFTLMTLIPLAVLNTINGLLTTINVSTAIIAERVRGRYDLMGLTPSGLFGVCWVLASRQVTRSLHLVSVRRLTQRAYLSVVFMMLFVVFGLLSQYSGIFTRFREARPDLITYLTPALNGYLLFAALWCDAFQSVISAALVGMIIPTFSGKRFENSVSTVVAFLVVQLAFYLVVVLVWSAAHMLGLAQSVAPGLLALLVSIALREAQLHALLRLLLERVNSDNDELTVSFRSAL